MRAGALTNLPSLGKVVFHEQWRCGRLFDGNQTEHRQPSSIGKEGDMSFLILIGTPETRNIMVQALAVPRFRESWGEYFDIEKCLPKIAGGNVARWAIEQAKVHDIRLVHTRNYVPLKTAFHADWLFVQEGEIAAALVERFPQFDTPRTVEKLTQERDALAEVLKQQSRKGKYDLGKLPPDRRRSAADRFIETDNKVKDLSERIDLLETAEGLRSEWSEAIKRDMIEGRHSESDHHPHCV
jgi:hypothetical protein